MDNLANAKDLCHEKKEIISRLNRIEGQIKGIRSMIEEGKSCAEILTQIAAVRAAVNKVGSIVLENYSKTCLQKALDDDEREKALVELMETVQKFLAFID